MTRVLFLTESFHPVLGGGETHIRQLAGALAATGFPSLVLTRRGESTWPVEEWFEGIKVVRVSPPGPGRSGKYRMLPFALLGLWRLRAGFDLLVVRGTRVLGLPGFLAARVLGKPVVLQPELNGELSGDIYTWGTRLQHSWALGLVRGATWLRNRLLRHADGFVAMSQQIRAEMLAAGVIPHKVTLIAHGVDTGRFRPAPAEERAALRQHLGLLAGARIVCYTGRLLRGKGLDDLLEAFAGLPPDAHLLIVGSGAGQALSVEEELRARAAALAGRVTFTGRVERVEDYLRASDVFAFPSVFEALGISLVEAAACGLPCIGARTGGIVDVIDDGRSGLLFPPGDVAALRAALNAVLADPARAAAMGRAARAVACARFDQQDSLDRYRALFRELTVRE